MDHWPFEPLNPLTYDLIMIDPPWEQVFYSDKGHGKAPQSHYDCMTLDDIQALPVSYLARGDCLLIMWVLPNMLPQAVETLCLWRFKYSTAGVWTKRTTHGKQHFGTGYRLRNACEMFLIGYVGRPRTEKNVRNWVDAKVREHSRKPDEIYEMAEALMPGARRCDLFARESRPGWDSWGNENTKFDESIRTVEVDPQFAEAF